ncbi:MAG: aspartate aminotransferase family protein, partial [Alphaproteobacteria bacterium]|nr:aspartate aminotransferase family protein [Alphaproteobacteria bacterium]
MPDTPADRTNFDLAAALEDAEARFAEANPTSAGLYEQACRAMPGGNTRTVLYYPPFPVSLARGDGCYVEDADGHRYADFVVEQTAGIY